jgi:hypothetical protein
MPPCPFVVALRREALRCAARLDDVFRALFRERVDELPLRDLADAAGRLLLESVLREPGPGRRLAVLALLRGVLAPEP